MAISREEIKRVLLKEDHEFRKLADKHQKLEKKIEELRKRSYLNPSEERELLELKKLKLSIKDKMEERIRSYKKKAER
ncbi:MAG: DUF465 domain-containing protein [Acidobacteria bacterium]|nr:DUF465 domain-containing protein [Acidobacteriota bacterium]